MNALEYIATTKYKDTPWNEYNGVICLELMESYAQEKVREKIDQHRALTRESIEELEHKLELERGISDGKNAIIESQQRREMELEDMLQDLSKAMLITGRVKISQEINELLNQKG